MQKLRRHKLGIRRLPAWDFFSKKVTLFFMFNGSQKVYQERSRKGDGSDPKSQTNGLGRAFQPVSEKKKSSWGVGEINSQQSGIVKYDIIVPKGYEQHIDDHFAAYGAQRKLAMYSLQSSKIARLFKFLLETVAAAFGITKPTLPIKYQVQLDEQWQVGKSRQNPEAKVLPEMKRKDAVSATSLSKVLWQWLHYYPFSTHERIDNHEAVVNKKTTASVD